MTVTGNCPPDCPSIRRAACLVHDAHVPEPVLAEYLRRHVAELKARRNAERLERRFVDDGKGAER